MSTDHFLQAFLHEADELLRAFETGVLALEVAHDDVETLNALFRTAHTLKGNSAMLGLDRITALTHGLEELLSRLRTGERAASPEIVNALLGATDVLRALIAQTAEGRDEPVPGLSELTTVLARHTTGLETDTAPVAAAATPATGLYTIRFDPPEDLLRRGLDPLRLLEGLADLGEIVRLEGDAARLPSLDVLDAETNYLAFRAWLRSRATAAEIEAVFEFVDDPGAVRVGREAATMAADAQTSGTSGEGGRRATEGDIASIRVATEKLDRLVDLVGELVITQSMVTQLVDQSTPEGLARLRDAVAQMDRHARDLQDRVMAMRMLPIRAVFGRFSRVVRDVAQAQGKHVELEIEGEETELDKTLIERIADPLMHLVRNAVDHGIESPAERGAEGKPPAGRLRLAASQQGGKITIEVADDGRGLDTDRILAKAVERGLASAGDTLTDEQVHALIFQPGFSTAEQVTEVSGRGVGMDVVKRNVEALGGSIVLQSVRGRGTTLRMSLPLTLAIVDGLSLRVGAEVYVLPLTTITESIRPTPTSVRTLVGRTEAFVVRGEVLPLLRLHRVFDIPDAVEDPTQGLTVLVEHEGRRVALLVDDLLGQQQVVIKSLEANYQRVDGVAGATILGDGRVALILDVPELVGLGQAA